MGDGFGETLFGATAGFSLTFGALESFNGLGEGGGLGEGLGGTGFWKCIESILPLRVGSSEIFSFIGFLAIGGGVSLFESNRFLTHGGASSENEPLFERTHGARFSSSLSSRLALLILSAGLRFFSWPAHGGGAWVSELLSSFLFLFSKASKSICPLFFKASCCIVFISRPPLDVSLLGGGFTFLTGLSLLTSLALIEEIVPWACGADDTGEVGDTPGGPTGGCGCPVGGGGAANVGGGMRPPGIVVEFVN